FAFVCIAAGQARAQDKAVLASVPPLAPLISHSSSELAPVVEDFSADLSALNRRYDAEGSPAQRVRMREFYGAWRTRLRELDFDKLSQEGRVDYVLLDNYLIHQLALLDRQNKLRAETAPILPFSDRLLALEDARRNLETINQAAIARTLADVAKQVDSLRAGFEPPVARPALLGDSAARPARREPPILSPRLSRTVANRAAENIDELRRGMTNWYRFYDGYDPIFTWWVRDPYRKLDSALIRYARTLRERVVGVPASAFTAPGGPQNAG